MNRKRKRYFLIAVCVNPITPRSINLVPYAPSKPSNESLSSTNYRTVSPKEQKTNRDDIQEIHWQENFGVQLREIKPDHVGLKRPRRRLTAEEFTGVGGASMLLQ
jgi:hypothetical protein